jgi:hypothetical protein
VRSEHDIISGKTVSIDFAELQSCTGPSALPLEFFPPGQYFSSAVGRNTPFIETCRFMAFLRFLQIAAEIQ